MNKCEALSTFESGAVRSSAIGKAPISQLDVEMLRQVALVMEFGEAKYDRGNWRKGIPFNRCLDSALRHVLSFKEGETLDHESNLPHLAHACANLMFLLRYEADNRVDLDDRDKISQKAN